jgi:hypothetical protein
MNIVKMVADRKMPRRRNAVPTSLRVIITSAPFGRNKKPLTLPDLRNAVVSPIHYGPSCGSLSRPDWLL